MRGPNKADLQAAMADAMRGVVELTPEQLALAETRREAFAAQEQAQSDREYDASELPNVPITQIRCGLGSAGKVRALLREWAQSLDPMQRTTADAMSELPIFERDSYPTNRFTLNDAFGDTVFVGNARKGTLDISPPRG